MPYTPDRYNKRVIGALSGSTGTPDAQKESKDTSIIHDNGMLSMSRKPNYLSYEMGTVSGYTTLDRSLTVAPLSTHNKTNRTAPFTPTFSRSGDRVDVRYGTACMSGSWMEGLLRGTLLTCWTYCLRISLPYNR